MKQMLCNKKYSGIFWAIILAGIFVGISLFGMQIFSGAQWYLFSSTLRYVFGFIILFLIKKIYGRTMKEVLSMKGSKIALAAGIGFLFYFLYFILRLCLGMQAISGLTAGIFLSKIILQQIATGFYEELNYRALILEGYFYGTQNVKNKLLYAFISFVLFGAVHVVSGWNTYAFLMSGAIGFVFAVMYLKSRNILLPMILHFIYDIFANLQDYVEWNNSTLFINLCSICDIVLVIMFVVSFVMLLGKDHLSIMEQKA